MKTTDNTDLAKKEYTAEEGLQVLTYLGLTNINEQEKIVFREKWDSLYQRNGQDFIGTIWELYADALPFICGDRSDGSFIAAQLRDKDFGRRVEMTGLEGKLKQGTPLNEVLEEGSWKGYF